LVVLEHKRIGTVEGQELAYLSEAFKILLAASNGLHSPVDERVGSLEHGVAEASRRGKDRKD
jgi:hypothetical protein